MDADVSYPLVVVPNLPYTREGTDPPDAHAFSAFLWRRFCQLAFLFFIALTLLRRLRMQAVLLRQQANYWRAQHQRAAQREVELKDQVHLLQGEIRELKRRLFGRKSETSSATQPKTNPKCRSANLRGTQTRPATRQHGADRVPDRLCESRRHPPAGPAPNSPRLRGRLAPD